MFHFSTCLENGSIQVFFFQAGGCYSNKLYPLLAIVHIDILDTPSPPDVHYRLQKRTVVRHDLLSDNLLGISLVPVVLPTN